MAFPAYVVITTLLFISGITNAAQQQHQHLKSINLGSSISPSKKPSSWKSSLRRFEFGFYQQDGGFSVGIWLGTFPDSTIVWTANRDDPPVSSNATLTLTIDGKLILRTLENESKTIAVTSEPASSASMLDSGNFVLYNNRSDIIWSSFIFPTDTILGSQSLYAGSELFSRISETNSSTGRFRLNMQRDGNLVLYPTNTIDEYTEAYWSSNTVSQQQLHLYLNNTGGLLLVNDSSSIIEVLHSGSLSENIPIIQRLTLGHDGILRLYSHYLVSVAYNSSVRWKAPEDFCDVRSFCGLNSYCTLYDDQPRCRCLPGTDFLDPNQMSSGCERNFVDERCKGMNISAEYNMTSMEKMTWYDYPYFRASITEEECKESCLEDCECDVALYQEESDDDGPGYCMKQKLPLKSAKRDIKDSSPSKAYFKTGTKNITISSDNYADLDPAKPQVRITSKKAITLILVMAVASLHVRVLSLLSLVFSSSSTKYLNTNGCWKLEALA